MKLALSLPTSRARYFTIAALSAVALFLAGPGAQPSAQAQAGGLSVSPTTVNFGRVTLGQLSPDEAITLTNSGGGPVQIRSITLQGLNRGQYGIFTNTCGEILHSNTSC